VRKADRKPSEPKGPEAQDPREVPFVLVGAEVGEKGTIVCPLCGSRFAHGELVCATCPLHAGCDLIRCPECGYQFPRGSRVVESARRFWARVRGSRP